MNRCTTLCGWSPVWLVWIGWFQYVQITSYLWTVWLNSIQFNGKQPYSHPSPTLSILWDEESQLFTFAACAWPVSHWTALLQRDQQLRLPSCCHKKRLCWTQSSGYKVCFFNINNLLNLCWSLFHATARYVWLPYFTSKNQCRDLNTQPFDFESLDPTTRPC